VRRRAIRRLFIDGLQGFDWLAPEPERLAHILSAFSSEFRGLGISTLFTAESDLVGSVLGVPISGLSLQGVSCIAEIILVTRVMSSSAPGCAHPLYTGSSCYWELALSVGVNCGLGRQS
jgi:hypothetical protein